MHARLALAEILLYQMYQSKHWTSIKIEVKVHYFVTTLEHKVNAQLLM